MIYKVRVIDNKQGRYAPCFRVEAANRPSAIAQARHVAASPMLTISQARQLGIVSFRAMTAEQFKDW